MLCRKISNTSGVSLLVAIIFVGALMMISMGLAETTINSIRDSRDYYRAIQARYASQGMLNAAMQKAHEGPRGGDISASNLSTATTFFRDTFCATSGSSGNTSGLCPASDSTFVKLSILTKASTPINIGSTAYYSTPAAFTEVNGSGNIVKGTGDSASECVDMDGSGEVTDEERNNADNPCHWRKLFPSVSHEIPLYGYSGTSDVITDNFILRVRIPCVLNGKYVEWCKGPADPKWPGERLFLYPQDDAKKYSIDSDPTLISWQIKGEITPPVGSTAQFSSIFFPWAKMQLGANSDKRNINYGYPWDESSPPAYNTEIYGTRINEAQSKNYQILTEKTWGQDSVLQRGTIFDFLKNKIPNAGQSTNKLWDNAGWDLRTIAKPVLQLYLAQPPADSSWNSSQNLPGSLTPSWYNRIPYLEYQVLTTNTAIAEEKIYVQSEVTLGGFTQKSESEQEFEIPETPFIIEQNY